MTHLLHLSDALFLRINDLARASTGLHAPAVAYARMTAIALPNGVDPKAFRDRIKARGILTAAGLGPYASRGFRIGHMGDIRMADVERTIDAVREALVAP